MRRRVSRADPPGPAPDGFLDHPRPLAFAHRGGSSHHPENSWPAFEYAVSLGYQYLETDAQATADGVVLAFHDRVLSRVTDGRGRIARLRYAEVARARIAGTEPIPLLADLITAWPDVRVNIDVKDFPVIQPLAEVLARTAAWDKVCVTSFSPTRLAAARRALARPVCMATSSAGVAALSAGLPTTALAARFADLWVRCTQVPTALASRRYLRRASAAGLQVHVWTVNDRVAMTRLVAMGVDGIITDDLITLRDVLRRAGQWHPRDAH